MEAPEDNCMEGLKYDNDKIKMELLPLDALYEIAKVLTIGCKKYGKNNWKFLEDGKNRYIGALLRHLTNMETEKYDSESKLLHSAHLATNALFILWYELNENNIEIIQKGEK